MFDYVMVSAASHQQAAEALRRVSARVAAPLVEEVPLPVLAPLRPVLPGLRRGQILAVEGGGSLALALLAGASAAGSWCAIVGLPTRGVLAAVAMGCAPGRLLLVDEPGQRWAEVVAALLEAVDVVLIRPPATPPAGVTRRLAARARQAGSCLVVAGPWEGAQLRLRIASSLWTGVGPGHGRLRARRVKVETHGRGAGGPPRSAWLWLPGPDGTVSTADLTAINPAGENHVGVVDEPERAGVA